MWSCHRYHRIQQSNHCCFYPVSRTILSERERGSMTRKYRDQLSEVTSRAGCPYKKQRSGDRVYGSLLVQGERRAKPLSEKLTEGDGKKVLCSCTNLHQVPANALLCTWSLGHFQNSHACSTQYSHSRETNRSVFLQKKKKSRKKKE